MNIKVVTYNIDGLPEHIDLRQQPWPLKPVSWIYSAFRDTTLVPINDNKNKAAQYIQNIQVRAQIEKRNKRK